MDDVSIQPLLDLAATRPEGEWPEQLDLDRFNRAIASMAPASRDVSDIADAVLVRDRVASILLDGSDADAYAILNTVVTDHAVKPAIDSSGVHYLSGRPDALSSLWAQLAGPLLFAVASGVRGRTKRCASAPCITPFIDASGGGREYCCARCATRERVRRHRAGRATS